MESARQIAYKALVKIQKNKGFSNLVINNALNTETLSPKDRAFVTALVYGVVERLITLDFIIESNSSKPINKLETNVLTILRMGVYQLYFMDSVTDSAAVNESVELTKKSGLSRASGFINAVLRSSIRNFNFEKSIDNIKDPIAKLSVKYSCPKWLIEMWNKQYGEQKTQNFLERSVGKPPVYVRTNTLLTTDDALIAELEKEGIVAQKDKLPNCLAVTSLTDCEKSETFKKGLFHVQDKSSQICINYAAANPRYIVLDVCAAPGGKTFTMAQYMQNSGKLYAFDLHDNRVNLIKSGAERLKISCIEAGRQDATVYNSQLPQADLVLCDVVCSGFGIIRRKPEIKYKPLEEIERLPEIQYNILNTAAKYVKKDGYIVYSTCTVNKNENEDVVARFIKENDDFEIVIPDDNMAEFFGEASNGCITLFGDDNNSDGFFMCKMKRVK